MNTTKRILALLIALTFLTSTAVFASTPTEPTIKGWGGFNNTHTRGEFLTFSPDWNSNYVYFEGRIYTRAEFFDAYHGSAFNVGGLRERLEVIVHAPVLREGVISAPRPIVAVVETPGEETPQRTGPIVPQIPRDQAIVFSDAELVEMIANAPTVHETAPVLPPPVWGTQSEIDAWVEEYWSKGGPNAYELEIIRLTNLHREAFGLPLLAICPNLMMAARMSREYYWALQRRGEPSGGHRNDLYVATSQMFDAGVRTANRGGARYTGSPVRHVCIYTGEDRGVYASRAANQALRGWMNSPRHRDNLLGPNHTRIGVGVSLTVQEGRVGCLQFFGR